MFFWTKFRFYLLIGVNPCGYVVVRRKLLVTKDAKMVTGLVYLGGLVFICMAISYGVLYPTE